MSFYECLCLCECFQGVMGGIVEHFLRGSYGKRDITKLVIDSFPWGQLIRFCHRSSAKRSECIDKNERLKTNQMVRPASVVHARKTQMQNKENNILFLFQMLEESVDTRRRLRHRVLIAALLFPPLRAQSFQLFLPLSLWTWLSVGRCVPTALPSQWTLEPPCSSVSR